MADEQHRGFAGERLDLRDQSLGSHSASQPVGNDRFDADFFADDLGGLAGPDERAGQEESADVVDEEGEKVGAPDTN